MSRSKVNTRPRKLPARYRGHEEADDLVRAEELEKEILNEGIETSESRPSSKKRGRNLEQQKAVAERIPESEEEILNEENETRESRPPPKKRRRIVKRVIEVKNPALGKIYSMFKRTVEALSNKVDALGREVKSAAPLESVNSTRTNEENELVETSNLTDGEITAPDNCLTGKDKVPFPDEHHITYNIRNINFEKPKFSGRGSVQPVTFLEDLETYLRKTKAEGVELDRIQDCLTNEARDWARVYRERWNDVEDFKGIS